MDKIIITHKCRTCLKTSSKLYPLTKPVTECTPNITYAQLLKNYAQFEIHSVHELHLPQYLCFLCSSQLKSTFVFVQQAQRCNVKLLNDLTKQFCLREQEIDLPEQDEASVSIKESPGNNADLDFTKQICLRENEIDLPKLQDKTSISIEEQSSDNHADLKDQDVCSFTASEDNSSCKNNLVTNPSFIEETMLTTDKIIEYDSEDYLDTNKSVMTAEQIIEYDFAVIDEMDNDSFTTETNEDTSTFIIKSNEEAFLSNKTDTLESVESFQGPVCNELVAKNDKFSKERRETIFSCEICLSTYNNKSEYIKHVNEKHKSEQQAIPAAVLENSVENQSTDNKNIKCRLCDYSCKTRSSLQYHKRSKHGTENDRIKCKFCSYTTLNKPYLFNHVKNFHKEIIQTLKANTIDNSNKRINSSTNNVLNNNCFANDLLTIPEVDKTTSDNSNDEQDKEEFIEEDDEDFIRNIINMKKIKRKKKLAPETLLTRCEDCGKILKNYKTLYSHRRYVHRSEDMLSSCSYCDKKFKRVTDLNIHIRQIHGPVENRQQPKPRSQEKRFMCAECSYTCRTSNLLNTHIRIHHTGEKPYKCDICSKSFVIAYKLKLHRYLHTGEKPYKCSICSKSYRTPKSKRAHMLLHTHKNQFTCDDCGKSFTQPGNLKVHKRIHLKENKLSCSVCGKFFNNNSMLNIHQINENHYNEAV